MIRARALLKLLLLLLLLLMMEVTMPEVRSIPPVSDDQRMMRGCREEDDEVDTRMTMRSMRL